MDYKYIAYMNCKEKSISENVLNKITTDISVCIVTDIVFWQYISMERNSKVANRYTKAQAFCDLLAQYCQQVMMTDEKKLPVLDYSLFARKWNWSRNVVREFIAHLINFKIIQLTSQSRGYTFKNSDLENILNADVHSHTDKNASQATESPKDDFPDLREVIVPP